ncbi:50S ribosomal protein L11 methyltransferase [candidate division KSB1 bacterium]|nr:50S ribosomal protein L11 methyltransferase [candidate division KSB1 bacterium]
MKKPESWICLAVSVNDHTREAISLYLFQSGARGVIEEPDRLHAYFAESVDARTLCDGMRRYLCSLRELGFNADANDITCNVIPEQDWNKEWKKHFHGFALSRKIFIKPTWEKAPGKHYPCLIEIDPEMAFGTGTHATTRLCLQLLESTIRGGEQVVDIGTGTGILAIAAAKLGARRIYAFDLDPIATITAVKNARQNGVGEQIAFYTGTLSAVCPGRIRPDIVFANVNRREIVKMLPLMKKLLDYPKNLIVSGILVEERAKIETDLLRFGFVISEFLSAEEWIACRVQNRSRIQEKR